MSRLASIPQDLYFQNLPTGAEGSFEEMHLAKSLWEEFLSRLRCSTYPIRIDLGRLVEVGFDPCDGPETKFVAASEAVVKMIDTKIQIEMSKNCGYTLTIEQYQANLREPLRSRLVCFPAKQ